MRAPGAERSTDWRSTDWRCVAAEATGFARRVGVVPVLVLLGAIGAVVAAGFLAGVRHGAPEPIDLPIAATGAPPPVATTQPSLMRVHLAGAVRHPGLYEVPANFRVGDLIDAAGGPNADADAAAVNLAERMRDGQQVYVPLVGEQSVARAEGADASGPLDVNSATAAQLQELPGIGPSLSVAIVAYRAEHGSFATLDALEQVPGIGPSKLSQLRPHAKV
ncbi:helix-hairpin-helix domain-containing protein [Candidatus Poriferisodalis sp.]|uniref:helix-hairpin-helix domain-containing protein n=1 Tax=Candidatus Poriferisodalis sp. TaxID=3101277 RepID=UPI003C6F07F2